MLENNRPLFRNHVCFDPYSKKELALELVILYSSELPFVTAIKINPTETGVIK